MLLWFPTYWDQTVCHTILSSTTSPLFYFLHSTITTRHRGIDLLLVSALCKICNISFLLTLSKHMGLCNNHCGGNGWEKLQKKNVTWGQTTGTWSREWGWSGAKRNIWELSREKGQYSEEMGCSGHQVTFQVSDLHSQVEDGTISSRGSPVEKQAEAEG